MLKHNNYLWSWWRSIDRVTVFMVLILYIFSIMLAMTASPAVAIKIGLHKYHFLYKQLIYIIAACVIMFLISGMDTLYIRRLALIGYAVNVILLVMVKFYGYEAKGSTRWIAIFGFSMQPSEFMKPFLAVLTAWILSQKMQNQKFPGFIVASLLYGLVAILIMLQPDIGMLVTISFIWSIQLFVAGMPFIWILLIVILSIITITSAYLFLPHVNQRINSFLDPDNYENYQVSKSLLAFETGGFYGKGPGEGTVKQLLPDAHTDFIFAVAAEEFGMVVCLVIALLFAFIVIRGLTKIIDEKDYFTTLSICGILSQFGIQSLINMGVTLNLLPTKGMTLPFISYGGSSTIATSIGMGMLMSFTKRKLNVSTYRHKINNLGII